KAFPAESNTSPGSDPKSNPLFVRAAGSGRSTPVNVVPPSVENMARIGSRWISLAPATTFRGSVGLMAIEVSLWDPHSWLASTFVPKSGWGTDPVLPVHSGTTSLETVRYLSYQEACAYADAFRLAPRTGEALPTKMSAAVIATRRALLAPARMAERRLATFEV